MDPFFPNGGSEVNLARILFFKNIFPGHFKRKKVRGYQSHWTGRRGGEGKGGRVREKRGR